MFPQSDSIITTPEQYEQDVATIMRDWRIHSALWLTENPNVLHDYQSLFLDAIKRCTRLPEHQAILNEFALYKDSEFRDAVACNEYTSVTLLGILAQDSDWGVRMSVASNSATPAYILEELSNDKSLEILKKVIDHRNVAQNTLRKLSDHHNLYIANHSCVKYYYVQLRNRAGVTP